VVIPQFNALGNLPPGVWNATVEEVHDRFAHTAHRQRLFEALSRVLDILREANYPEVHLDGSYVTAAAEPGDYDLVYEPIGMKKTEAWKELLALEMDKRKALHLGDIFIHMSVPPFFMNYINFWQTDDEENPKGIIRIELRRDADD
jgi:hypothetical protein